MLGSLANVDEYRSEHLPSFVAMTVRFFDPKARQWAIHCADNRYGTLGPPMRGAFDGDLARMPTRYSSPESRKPVNQA